MASISTRQRRDGTTAYRVQFRTTPGGNPVVETFNTAGEAAYFADLVDRIGGEAARAKRDLAGNTQTPALAAILEKYLAQAPDITPGTAQEYRRVLARSGIERRMGTLPVDLITQEDVIAWVRDRTGTPSKATGRAPAPKTIRNEHGLLSTLLGYAVDRGHITVNVAKGVRLPAKRPPSIRVLTDAEVDSIRTHLRPRYQPLIRWLAVTGMRWGEATAIQWRDIRPGNPATVTVSRAWKHGDGPRALGAPKTVKGNRTITIPQALLDELPPKGKPSDFIFTTERGNPIHHAWFHTRVWRPAIASAGVSPAPRLHDLRHYCASVLLAHGVPMHAVSARLGHEKITTTVDVYSFLTPDMQTAGLDRMAAMFAPQIAS